MGWRHTGGTFEACCTTTQRLAQSSSASRSRSRSLILFVYYVQTDSTQAELEEGKICKFLDALFPLSPSSSNHLLL